MPDVILTNVPPNIFDEWSEYAQQSGLPLDYLILEAVTYSVRSDRLGVEAARLICAQRQKTLVLTKKHVQKHGSSPQDDFHSPTVVVPEAFDDSPGNSPHSGQVVHNLPVEYMDSTESSAALEDHVPRNL